MSILRIKVREKTTGKTLVAEREESYLTHKEGFRVFNEDGTSQWLDSVAFLRYYDVTRDSP